MIYNEDDEIEKQEETIENFDNDSNEVIDKELEEEYNLEENINENEYNENTEENKESNMGNKMEEEKKEPKTVKKESTELIQKQRNGNSNNNKSLKTLIIIVAIVVVIVAIMAGFAIINKFNTKVYNNIYLKGQNMAGMTIDDVKNYVLSIYEESLGEVKIDAYQGEKLLDIVEPMDIELIIDVDDTINQIFDVGRKGNFFTDNIDILMLMFNKKEFDCVYSYNEDKLRVTQESISNAIDNRVVDDEYELDENSHKLVIIKGHKGNEIDSEKYKTEILKLLKEGKSLDYQIPVKEIKPKELDTDRVYSEVRRDAIDAHVIETPGQKPVFKAEIYGYDFNKQDLIATLAKEENKEEDKKITYDLIVTEPKVKYRDIAWSAYESRLGSLTTYFPASNYNRAKNIQIALGYLNGIVIMPGETFSFNKTVGDVTAAKGYLPAATFKNGTVVDEVGGGICQTVSTLYNAALYANLEIVTRYQHALAVGYVRPSLDATMYYPSLDFKFKNNRNYPIKIVTSYSSNGSMNISLYGTKEDVEYEIVLDSRYLSTLTYTTKYIDDPSLPAGTQKVKVSGANGYTSESYKITKLDGKIIKSELLSRDTYKPTTKIVLRGIGSLPANSNNTSTEAPPSTPSVSTGNSASSGASVNSSTSSGT